jgi:hypothetical protein
MIVGSDLRRHRQTERFPQLVEIKRCIQIVVGRRRKAARRGRHRHRKLGAWFDVEKFIKVASFQRPCGQAAGDWSEYPFTIDRESPANENDWKYPILW